MDEESPFDLEAWLVVLLPAVLGAVVGWGLGNQLSLALLGAVSGGLLGLATVTMAHWRQARRFKAWLYEGAEPMALSLSGFWGEQVYRVERLLGERDERVTESERDLRQFFEAIEASPIGVLILDREEAVVWCNAMAAQHFSLDPQRDRGQRLAFLVRTPAFVSYLQQRQYEQPVVFAAPGGQARLSVLVRPFGKGMRLVLSQDVTERERTEAMRRDFVANVSHEIRTPLTVVAGFIETMSDLPLSEPERRRVLLLMQEQTQRMQALVGDLLALAQLEGSPNPAADRWLPAAAVLRRALAEAKALSAGRHQFEADFADDAELTGSEGELHSAISNLLNNAVRYTPEGGRIQLRWRWRGDGAALIEVQDDGPGIAREHLPRLTERFYRVDGSRSRDTGGTGLGLSIVKHVAQRHGGEIEIQSEPGRGACFSFVLPPLRVRPRASVTL
jgi:two-component system phosphate regulon sensor histidine kinase PhoR